MKQTHHTPGNWTRNGNQIVAIHEDEDGEHETLIADVFDQHDWYRANARLIASAPELLDALEAQAEAAQAVIDNWAEGDLAGAVRRLNVSILNGLAAIAKAKAGAA